MAKSDVLERVAVDFAQGRTDSAIRRLSSLVAAHPTDLDLRRRLAAAYRMVGNAIEAGRWSYLSADADPDETAAFERAYPAARKRMSQLRWPEREGHAATEFARTRLADLSAAASAATRDAITRQARRGGERRSAGGPASRVALAALTLLVGASVAALAVLGVVTVVQWLIG